MKKAAKILSVLIVLALSLAMIGCGGNSAPVLEYLFTGSVTITSAEGVTLDAKGNDVSWSVTGVDNGDDDTNNDLATYNGTGVAAVSAAGLVTPLVQTGSVRVFGTLKSDPYRYGYYDVSWDFTSSEGGEQGGEEPEIPPAAYNYAGPDSWDFVSQSADLAWAKAATGVAGGTDAGQSDGITFTNNADIEIAGAGNVSKLVLTGGTYIAYNDKNLGLRVYNKDGSPEAALKMTGLTGKLKVSVDWYSLKADGRTLTLKVGNTTKVGTAADGVTVTGTGTTGNVVFTQETLSETFDIGDTPVDLSISVSKHLFIKSITIEDAAGATEKSVTVKIPSFETGIANTTDAVYSIGYDESITADGLIAKMNADENMAAAYTAIVSMYQNVIDGILTASGLSAGEVTVTKDHIAFYFFANTEDWTAFDNADEDDAEAIAAAVAKAVTTINAGEAVYIDFGMTDALRTAVANKIASIGATATTDSWDLTGTNVTGMTVNGYTYSKTNDNDYVYTAVTALSSTATILATDAIKAGATGNLNLIISKYSGTGSGTTKAGVAEAPDFAATAANKPGNSVQWKADSSKGLLVKRDGLKIEGVKGSVTLTVKWFMNSKKSANDRYLEVTVGNNDCIRTGTTDTSAAAADMEDFVLNIDGGTEGVDVFIGASNELYIKGIIITEQQ